jgi:hypothetical protein
VPQEPGWWATDGAGRAQPAWDRAQPAWDRAQPAWDRAQPAWLPLSRLAGTAWLFFSALNSSVASV